MEKSYNGWTASPRPSDFGGLVPLVVGTESFRPGVRKGDVYTAFQYLATQFHKRVERLDLPGEDDEWGYAYRTNRNADNLSCHASATAIDVNATRHPNKKAGTFSAAAVKEIRAILAELGGVVRWGGDFSSTKDEMHFEINASAAELARAVRNLNKSFTLGERMLEVGSSGDDVGDLQRRLGVEVDNDFGPKTEAALIAFQKANALDADGVFGPATFAALNKPKATPPLVGGAILTKLNSLGTLTQKFGAPVTSELTCPDGVGKYNHFHNAASIYWTPETGAFAVYGAIRVAWSRLGWERSILGYPTSDEFDFDGGRRQEFQKGVLFASPAGVFITYRVL